MIQVKHLSGSVLVILRPNRSLSWKQAKLVVLFISCFCLTIAIAWMLLGAWLILPFAGLEVTVLAIVMYFVAQATHSTQVLHLNEKHISIQKGKKRPETSTLFERENTVVKEYPGRHPEDAMLLVLKDDRRSYPIAEFLNLSEQEQLISVLKKLGVPHIKSYTPVNIDM